MICRRSDSKWTQAQLKDLHDLRSRIFSPGTSYDDIMRLTRLTADEFDEVTRTINP